MRDAVAVASAQQAKLIHVPGDVWQQVGHFDARLPVLAEGAQWREQFVFGNVAARLEVAERFWNGLAGESDQVRFGIEQIDVAWPARHEEENDITRARRKMRQLGCERVDDGWRRNSFFRSEQTISPKQRGQRQQAKPATGTLQELATARRARGWPAGSGAMTVRISPHRQRRSD